MTSIPRSPRRASIACATTIQALRAFLYRMPKGGDLHVHLSGAAYAERLIDWAAQQGLCVRVADWFLGRGAVHAGQAFGCRDHARSKEIRRHDQRHVDAVFLAVT